MSLITLPVVLDLVAKATVILAVTGLAASLLRRASAATRHFVWTLGIISALVAPALTVALPAAELFQSGKFKPFRVRGHPIG